MHTSANLIIMKYRQWRITLHAKGNMLVPNCVDNSWRRYFSTGRGLVMPTHHSGSVVNSMSIIPESYNTDAHYDYTYKSIINPGNVSISRHRNIHNIRRPPLMSQTVPISQSDWNPSIMAGLDPIESFVSLLHSNWQSTNADAFHCFAPVVHKPPGEKFGGLQFEWSPC